MWFGKKSSRRRAVQAGAAEAESQLRAAGRSKMAPVLLIGGVFFVLATAIMYWPMAKVQYRVGDTPSHDLLAPVPFSSEDPDVVKRALEQAKANAAPVLVQETRAFDQIQSRLTNLQENVKKASGESLVEVHKAWPGLTPAAELWLRNVDSAVYLGEVRTLMASLSKELPIVDAATADELQQAAQRGGHQIFLAEAPASDKPDAEDAVLEKLIYLADPTVLAVTDRKSERKQTCLRECVMGAFPQDMAGAVVNYLMALDVPTYHYDAKLTMKQAELEAARKLPPATEFKKNAPIVRVSDLKETNGLTSSMLHELEAAQAAYERSQAQQHPWGWLLWRVGQALSVLVLTVAGALYVTKMNLKLNTAARGWALGGLMLLTLFIAKGPMAPWLGWVNLVYLIGIGSTLLTTVILVIAYNQRFALGMAAIHGLLVTLALGQGFDYYLATLTGVAVFTFGLKEIRTRGKLIEMGLFAGAALMAAVWALGLARFGGSVWSSIAPPIIDLPTLTRDSLLAAGAGLSIGFITLGVLPFIERVFKITTAMTLLELCDLNRPALRRLAQEAPGTFNHSLVVGTLTEAAGNAIGANGLLCRVGAYYHDIGKLSKPQYFIENQSGGPSRHDKLSPAMSLLIIVGHVKDGVELAREYNLPWVVHQFIAQHHGTTLVEYFYHAAKERQARDGEGDSPAVSETEFRYPGPKPQTRETAILMICDGVESIVRSLPEPTAGRIEAAVHQLVMKRLMDGQFSECDLTLRELGLIEESLVRTLAGVYHGRVSYPKPLAVSQPA